MTIKPLPGQPSLFDAAPAQPKPGSPREWIERTKSGLCGVCGVNASESQPDAHKTILQSTSDQYCRVCFQATVQGLAESGITLQEE